jgi:hypothetical protein
MEIPANDWARAQELLVKLVQILTPFAEQGAAPKEPPLATPFSQRLFIPPLPQKKEEKTRFPFDVKLLTTLRLAEREMARWIETPAPREEPLIETKQETERIFTKSREESLPQPLPPKETPPKETAAPAVRPLPLRPEGRPVPPPPRRENGPIHKPAREEERKLVQTHAQKIVVQVRAAIQTLSQFSQLEDPKAAPFKEVMKKLKPLIDELIEAVGRGEQHAADDEALPFSRAVRLPPKQQKAIPKPISMPETAWPRREKPKETKEPKKPQPIHHRPSEKKESIPFFQSEKKETAPTFQNRGEERPFLQTREEKRVEEPLAAVREESKPLVPMEKRETKRESPPRPNFEPREAPKPIPPTKEKATPPVYPSESREAPPKKESERTAPFERISLSAAPFIPQIPASFANQKKSKKKGFWFRDEEEEERDSRAKE